ncbi:hypothetical protein CQW29_22930 [Pantoea coffeiphila]|uniref:Uncharacterized protein n=1 Tax=Pantoea coffeiphila TaxID=1465635 RepID=A0A2S9I5S1_9GAMM|nr:hypothetical protein CQW29_22930 [Pantoea coffeiphila]
MIVKVDYINDKKKFTYRTMGYWVLILKVNEYIIFEKALLGIPLKKAQAYIHNFTYLGEHRYRSRIIDGNKLLVRRIPDNDATI